MMENDEMIYTAIFQNKQGELTHSRYTGVIGRREAWRRAADMGETNGDCLVALVPGDHPVYTYENTMIDREQNITEMKNHDVFELPEEDVYQMT